MIDFDKIDLEEGPFAKRLAKFIRESFKPERVLDLGCGPGTYVYALRDQGISAIGIDSDDRVVGKPYLIHSLISGNDLQEDLVLCLEVMEHISKDHESKEMDGIAKSVNKNGILIFTAAFPGQGGDGHINCKERVEWLNMLTSRGFKERNDIRKILLDYIREGYHMGWFVINLIVLERI
jgi:SAM-dependent methyltransferase